MSGVRTQRLTSLVAVIAVVGVGATALLAGSEHATTPGVSSGDGGQAAERLLPRDAVRTAPVFSGAAALPPVEPGRLRGTVVLSDRECETVALTLVDLRAAPAPHGCVVDVSPRRRFALVRDDRDGPGHVVDLRTGQAAVTPLRLGRERPPTLDDDGAVHRCSNGFSETLRFRRATPSRRPGCLPVRLGGRSYVSPAPDSAPLQLEDATGRALRLDPEAPPEGPPFALAGSPAGDLLAVVSTDERRRTVVGLYRVRDGAALARWRLDDDADPQAVRVAHGGTLVAVRLRSRRLADDSWRLLRRDDPTPVARVGGERLPAVAFSPDGRHVAVVTEPGRVCVVLDAATLRPVGRLPPDETVAVGWLD